MIDERGELTYRELDERANALANAWRERGLKPGDGVAILARNHRGFLEALFAAAKCGARIVLMNTGFSGPQIREVAGREGTDLFVYDEEYSRRSRGSSSSPRDASGPGPTLETSDDTLDALIAGAASAPPKPAKRPAARDPDERHDRHAEGRPAVEPRSLSPIGGPLSKVPFRPRGHRAVVPMFHALGFPQALVGVGPRLDARRPPALRPRGTLDSLERHQATAMVVVPVMLPRIVDLGEDEITQPDLSSLRIIFVCGSQFGAELAQRALARVRPGALQPVRLDRDRVRDDRHPRRPASRAGASAGWCVAGRQDPRRRRRGAPQGETGRIFVGNAFQFEGYTGGGDKELIAGLMSSGDVGHFD